MKRTATAPKESEITKKTKKTKDFSKLTVNYTGIRDGETIVGVNYNQTDGVEMLIRATALYHPIDECPPNVIRDQFKRLAFFSKMTFEERKDYLAENLRAYKSGKENHLYDPHNSLSVKFTKIQSKYFIDQLGEEVIASLLAKEDYMPMTEVYQLFKPKDKVTKANRHSLVLRPENFAIKSAESKCTSFEGLFLLRLSEENPLLDLDQSGKKVTIKSNECLLAVDNFFERKMSIIYQEHEPLVKATLFEAASALLSESEVAECVLIEPLLAPFSPSLLKSLLQKIIRTKCDFVTHDDKEYTAKPFLLTCFILLSLHTGSYNLNKQRFVTGLESALKRLAIITCEDSHTDDTRSITLLLTCAFIRQQNRAWVPSMVHMKRFLELAIEAHESCSMFEYETSKVHYIRIEKDKKVNDYVLNAIILEKLGSMTGDINLFGHLAMVGAKSTKYSPKKNDNALIKIPLIHCIDQHSYTSIAHFMPYGEDDDDVEEDGARATRPFSPLFSRIWSNVGSLNGRRDRARILVMEQNEFVKEVRGAQTCIYAQKFGEKIEDDHSDAVSTYEFNYKIDDSWIAGLIGPLSVKIGKPAVKTIVVLRVDDVMEMSTIRNPKSARSNSSNDMAVDLTAEEKEESIEEAKKLLRAGCPLLHVPAALQQFKGAIVRLVDQVTNDIEKKYVIRYADSKNDVDWDEATNIRASIPEFVYPDDGASESYTQWLELAIATKSNGIAKNAFEILERVLDRYPISVIKRLLMYIANYRPTIKLYDIARDGSSSKLEVSVDDIGVNHILCAICALFPVCLELGASSFDVKYGPLLWKIRDLVKKRVDDATMTVDLKENAPYWAPIPGDLKNDLFEHQRDSLNEMIKKNKRGKKGHEIFVSVGMGKTGILLSFIQYLVENRRCPTYVVYSAPPSALANARSEFDRFGVPYVDVVTSKSKGKKNKVYQDAVFQPFKINIVAHDQMRRDRVHAQLKEHAPDTLFVVDEFHLATSADTIRSSIALEIARLSRDFVAMTGTIVRNDNPSDLIRWLEMIVEFYVNAYNYLVAFGALVSKKASTGVRVKNKELMCEMTQDEEERYHKNVTARLGGHAVNFDFLAAIKICYEAADREMVSQINRYVLEKSEIVFVLARNKAHQESLRDAIVASSDGKIREKHIFLVDKDHSIILKPETKTKYKVVITTLMHVTGYTLTKCRVSVGSVYPSNESTRNQYEGRMNRIGQTAKEIKIITVHCGVLSYMLEHYKRDRSFAEALKEFADDVGLDYRSFINDVSK